MGRVSYQFGYQIVLAHFKIRYQKLELEEDLFIDYPEAQNIPLTIEVRLDDSTNLPPHPIT